MNDLIKNNRRMILYLIVANFLLYFGFRIWEALFNNFAVEEIGVGPNVMGWIQALRELPGLLGFLLGFLALFLSEVRIISLSLIFLGVGTMFIGQAQDVLFLMLSTFVMSIGFHFFLPSNNSVVLMTAKQEDAPALLGWLSSLGAVAAVLATATVYLLADGWGYRTLFRVTGGFVAAGGFLLLPLGKGNGQLPSYRRIVLRRQYRLYYVLSFLMGSRRHIFTTFAVYLLVREKGISVQTTAILLLVNSLVNAYAMQAMGKMIGRFGERRMLTLAFACLVPVFVGYAFIESLQLLFVLFILDNLLFGFNLALTTYFQKIAMSPEEITGNLSVEQTINHVAAVVVPIIGGTVWQLFGSQAPFLAGAALVLVSLVLVQFIRTPTGRPTVVPALAE